MYFIRRKTTEPGTPIKVAIDNPTGGDGGFLGGGQFYFYPAGSTEGSDSFQVGDLAAGAIMGDPELAKHFDCTPPWKPAGAPKSDPDKAATKPATAKQ